MNAYEQFLALLNSLDLGEHKESLQTAFKAVQGVGEDLKVSLKDEREKTKPLKDRIKAINSELGLDENASIEDVQEYKKNMANTAEFDKVKEQLTSKYEKDMTELRGFISEKDKALLDVNAKFEDTQFRMNIQDKGLLKMFGDNPLVIKSLTDALKSQIIFDNGNAFVNDGNGQVQKDTLTGEPLPVSKLIEKYATDSVYKDFLVNPISANGSNVQGGNGTPSETPTDTSKFKDVNSFMGEALKQIKV